MQARRLISFQSSSGHSMHVLLCPTTHLTCEFVQVAIYAMQSLFVQATNAPWSNQVSAEQDAPAEWGHKKSCIAQNRQNCLRATRVTWREWILSLVTRNWWRGASWENWAVVRVVPNTWGTRNGESTGNYFFLPSQRVLYSSEPPSISVRCIRRTAASRLTATAAAVQKPLVGSQAEGPCSPLTSERSIIPSTLPQEWFSDKRSCAFLPRGGWPLLTTHIKPPRLWSSFIPLTCPRQSEIIYKEAFTCIWVRKIHVLLQNVLYFYFLFKM